MFKKAFLTGVFLVGTGAFAHAAADFYGVQMKSEDFTQDVFLIENSKIPDFSNDRPGTDKRVYAFGYMSGVVGGGHGFSVEVFNHSDKTLSTERLFRELTIVTYNGRRYDRSETEMMWSRERLDPGQEATFNFKFPGIHLQREEIRMVICSFDLSGTSIYLFPLSQPEKPAPKKAEPPKKVEQKPAVKKVTQKTLSKKEEPGKKEEKKPAAPFCPAPIKMMQSFFRGVGERISGARPTELPASLEGEKAIEVESAAPVPAEDTIADKQRTPDYPLVKPDQVIEGARYHFSPDFRKEVLESQKQVESAVYRDRPWSLSNPDQLFTHEAAATGPSGGFPRREAKVLVANLEYGFIVVDAGFESGVGKNVILNVMRNGRRIGKVMVTKPRDKISGAIILPEWRTRDEIRSGDLVGMSV